MIRWALFIGFLVGLLYLALVGCFPKYMTLVAFGLAFLVLLAAGLYILFRPVQLFSPYFWNILIVVGLILVGIGYLIYMSCQRR
jgi:hypothetical protein